MASFKGSQTEKNILEALQGESMARNKYTFYAEQARREGNDSIAELYERMAANETAHAKIWFRFLNGGLGDSISNVQESAMGETEEFQVMYPKFAAIAHEEGFEDIAQMFERVADIEHDHAETFIRALATLTQKNGQPVLAAPRNRYRCMFCGAVYDDRPDVCPVCEAIGSFEEVND